MKYRIKHIDSTWLWFTPLAFLNMGGTDTYLVQKYEGIWPFGKWKELYRSKSKEYCYISLMKEKYNLEVPCEFEWNWNARYEWFSKVGKLRLIERERNFFAGYYDEEKSNELNNHKLEESDSLDDYLDKNLDDSIEDSKNEKSKQISFDDF